MPQTYDLQIDGKHYDLNWTNPQPPTQADIESIVATYRSKAPKPAAPVPATPPDRKSMDKFRMDYFNTDDPDANIPMQTAQGLAKNPKDPKWLAHYQKDSPVAQAVIREKADEFAKQAEIDNNSVLVNSGPTFGGEAPIGAAMSMDKRTGQANYVPPSHYIAEAIHGPEGARKMEEATGALPELERAGLSMADPENLAFMAAGGYIANLGKVGVATLTGGAAALGGIQGYQKYKKGDKGGAAVDVALGLLPAAAHKIGVEYGKSQAAKAAAEKANLSQFEAPPQKIRGALPKPPVVTPAPPRPADTSGIKVTIGKYGEYYTAPPAKPAPFELAPPETWQSGLERLQGRQESPSIPQEFKPTHTVDGEPVVKRSVGKANAYFDEQGARVTVKGKKVEELTAPISSEDVPKPLSHVEFDPLKPNIDIGPEPTRPPGRPFSIVPEIAAEEAAKADAVSGETTPEPSQSHTETTPKGDKLTPPDKTTHLLKLGGEHIPVGNLVDNGDGTVSFVDYEGIPGTAATEKVKEDYRPTAEELKPLAKTSTIKGRGNRKTGAYQFGAAPGSRADRFNRFVEQIWNDAKAAGKDKYTDFVGYVNTQHPGRFTPDQIKDLYSSGKQFAQTISRLPVKPVAGQRQPDPGKGTGRYASTFKGMNVAALDRPLMAKTHTVANAHNIGQMEAALDHLNIQGDLDDTELRRVTRFVTEETLGPVKPGHPQLMQTAAEKTAIMADPRLRAAVKRIADVYQRPGGIEEQSYKLGDKHGITPAIAAAKRAMGGGHFLNLVPPKEAGEGASGFGRNLGTKMQRKGLRVSKRQTGTSVYEMEDLHHILQTRWRELAPQAALHDWYNTAEAAGLMKDRPDAGWSQATAIQAKPNTNYIRQQKNGTWRGFTKKGTVYVPSAAAEALADAVGLSKGPPGGQGRLLEHGIRNVTGEEVLSRVGTALGKANVGLKLTGNPAMALTHAANRAALLRGIWDPTAPLAKNVAEAIPLVGQVLKGIDMAKVDIRNPDVQAAIRRLYYSGAGTSRPFTRYESSVADRVPVLSQWQHGVHEGLFGLPKPNKGPMGLGVMGWDMRMQVVAEQMRSRVEGNNDPNRIREFQSQFSHYSASISHGIEFVSRFNVFAKTRVPRVMTSLKQVAGVTGLHAQDPFTQAKIVTGTIAKRAAAVVVTAQMINHARSGHWMQDNKKGHRMQVQITPDGPDALYSDLRGLDSVMGPAMELTGLREKGREEAFPDRPGARHRAGWAELGVMGAFNVGIEEMTPVPVDTLLEGMYGKALVGHRTKDGSAPEQITTVRPGSTAGQRWKQAAIDTVGPSKLGQAIMNDQDNPTKPQGRFWEVVNYFFSSPIHKDPTAGELAKLRQLAAKERREANR